MEASARIQKCFSFIINNGKNWNIFVKVIFLLSSYSLRFKNKPILYPLDTVNSYQHEKSEKKQETILRSSLYER